MKKTLVILLAALMMLSCFMASASAYTVPANVNKIDGLPELPSVPTMKTKNNGKHGMETITVDGAFESIAAVYKWQEFPIEVVDGVGVYSLDEFTKAQQGMGTYGGMWYGDVYISDAGCWSIEGDLSDPYVYGAIDAAVDLFGDNWCYVKVDKHTFIRRWIAEDENGNFCVYEQWYGAYYGTYEMGYAFTGKTADGIDVKYDRFGRCVERTQVFEGTNFFGNDVEGKATVTWHAGIASNGKRVAYISKIIEEYEGSDIGKITAEFAQNGKTLRWAAAYAEKTEEPADEEEEEEAEEEEAEEEEAEEAEEPDEEEPEEAEEEAAE